MNKVFKFFSIISMILICANLQAQTQTPEPTDFMRSNGKIYVVVAVVITILFGMFLYLINLDRKISKLEKQL